MAGIIRRPMLLTSGTRLGSYVIEGPLGAGGMGEVYRGRDTKLNRDVAIKILPEAFAADPDRLQRFSREAQTLAALNHTHIAQIYGVEDSSGVRALVMELVEGEDLAQRIARGPIAVAEALPIARQIADALEAAHERGIIHRDLKPANIKVREDGTVKVLDFGLAKALDPQGPGRGSDVANSPTFTMRGTQMGMIVGTAAYMAPEQARGQAVDRRADLWAFGVVLYEMLAGRGAFDGATVTDVLAAVVTREPDWSALPADTPPGIRRLLRRCLDRDRHTRLADAGEARYQIDEARSAPPPAVAERVSARSRVAWLPWALAAVLLVTTLALVWRVSRPTDRPVVRYVVQPPDKTALNLILRPALALSPDGRTLVFVGGPVGASRLFIRRDDEFEARALAGSEGASEPVFSPDGQWLAFFANNELKRMPIAEGPVVTLVGRGNEPKGLSWDGDGTITYTPESTGPVFQIPAGGGTPRAVSALKAGERTHRWPQMLPDGKAVLFTVGTAASPDNYDGANIEAVVLATGERRQILAGASMARYLAGGYLVFARGRTLYAVRFDMARLAVLGTPKAVVQGVAGDSTTGVAHFSCAASGALAYVPGEILEASHRLVWVDRAGKAEPIDLPPGPYFDPHISPDGRKVAMGVLDGQGSDIRVYDFDKKTFARLTFGGTNTIPIWSRDGQFVYYVAIDQTTGVNTISRRAADGSRAAEALVSHDSRVYLRSISADGVRAHVNDNTVGGFTDIGFLPLVKGAAFAPLVATKFDEYASELSPDGRWIAYQSNDTARFEVYVREVSGPGLWQISTGGGEEPRWSPDGRSLYYRNDTQMMVAPVETRGTFQPGTPTLLFEGVYNLRSDSGNSYDLAPNGERFLMLRSGSGTTQSAHIRVVWNWSKELESLGK
jgi:eukaryotic-like serine/threonine-protein kinase